MSEMKNLLDWFGKRKGNSVQAGMRKHGLAVLDVVSEVNRAITSMSDGDPASTLKGIDRMILSEREADRIEDRLCAEITGGEISVQEREDLLRVVRKTDKVADWATQAGIHIQLSVEIGAVIPEQIWDAMKLMSTELVLAVKMLLKAYENLSVSSAELERSIEAVKDQERIIDQINFASVKKILMSDMECKGIMLMKGLVESLEMSADACKSCADTLSVLMAARKN